MSTTGGVKVIMSGIDEFDARIHEMIVAVSEVSEGIVTEGGHLIERNYKKSFRAGHGPVKSWTTGQYPASPPFPTSRSGNLRNSTQVRITRIGSARFMSETAPTTVYGRAVELGNPGNKWGPTRPFPALSLAYTESLPELREIYTRSWAEALRI